MNILNLMQRFPDEASCIAYLRNRGNNPALSASIAAVGNAAGMPTNCLSSAGTAISNAKRLLLDVHHKIKGQYLQLYLNEFCYKLNRRYFGETLFDRVILAAVTYTADFKSRTYRRTLYG